MIFLFFILMSAESTVLGVAIVQRHGARAPLKQFLWDKGEWAQGYGQLTPEGIRQNYLNGVEFRRRYITGHKIISENFNASEIYVRSTDFGRTIASVYQTLLGLFPNGPVLTHNKNPMPVLTDSYSGTVKWDQGTEALPNYFSPVPVHVVHMKYDYLLLNHLSDVCPRCKVLRNKTMSSENYLNTVNNYNEFLRPKIEKIFQSSIDFFESNFYLDALQSIKFHGFDWPEKMTEELYEEMEKIQTDFYDAYFEGQATLLAASDFFSNLLANFKKISDRSSKVRMWMYLAHDTTLLAFLKALRVYQGKVPDYASSLVFELIEENGLYIKIVYNDKVLSIPGCSEVCPFTEFNSFLASWLIDDIKSACEQLD